MRPRSILNYCSLATCLWLVFKAGRARACATAQGQTGLEQARAGLEQVQARDRVRDCVGRTGGRGRQECPPLCCRRPRHPHLLPHRSAWRMAYHALTSEPERVQRHALCPDRHAVRHCLDMPAPPTHALAALPRSLHACDHVRGRNAKTCSRAGTWSRGWAFRMSTPRARSAGGENSDAGCAPRRFRTATIWRDPAIIRLGEAVAASSSAGCAARHGRAWCGRSMSPTIREVRA